MRNHSYENDFDLHENETARRTYFHVKGFALRLVLKQRHKATRKWPIEFGACLERRLPARRAAVALSELATRTYARVESINLSRI